MTGSEEASAGGLWVRLKAVRRSVRSTATGKLVLRIVVSVLGLAVIAVGVVLLPLPGPGWLVIFAGLGILASEFDWAARLLHYARDKVSTWTRWAASRGRPLQALLGAVGLVVLGGLFAASWWFYAT